MTPAGVYSPREMTHRTVLFLLVFRIIFAWLPVSAPAMDKDRPFHVGEKLTFKLRWMFIPAGEAVLQVLPIETIGGVPAWHFLLTARTNAFVDNFYKVRDNINAWADKGLTRSLRYEKKQREGKTHREVVVDFDWHLNLARYANFDRQRDPLPLLPGALDPLSAFYHVRGIDLDEGMIIQKPITDGKKCVIGMAKVVKRETIRVGEKSYDTYLLEPELKHVGGVFEKDKDATIKVWVTADRHRIPVRLTSKVAVGSFVGELVSVE